MAAAPTPQLAAQTGDDRGAIQELLDEHAAAYLEGQEGPFLEGLSTDSPAFRARRRDFLAWSRTVPFASYELEADWERAGNLARAPDRARYRGAEDVVIALVEERYRIEGFDERAAVEEYYLTFVKRSGVWRIADDSDLEELGLFSVRHLWDFGPVELQEGDHFSLMRHPCGVEGLTCVELPANLLATAEQALAQVDRGWSVPWRHRVLIYVPASADELARMIQATFPLDNFVAFAYSTYEAGDGYDLTGYRIMLNWEQIQGRDDAYLRSVLAHELLHIATRPVTGPFVPTFVEEGLAEHVAQAENSARLSFLEDEVAAGRFDGELPRDFEFLTGDGTDIYRSYQEGLAAADFFAERFGERRLARFYLRLGRVEFAPGTSAYHVGRALERTVGSNYDNFERAWADSIVD
ncbi:hypothetical protein BH20ACT21_BH20ACT21_23860 [soil metagenome]